MEIGLHYESLKAWLPLMTLCSSCFQVSEALTCVAQVNANIEFLSVLTICKYSAGFFWK